MTWHALAAALLALGVASLFVWVLIPLAQRIGLVDHPGGRKTHEGSVPAIGGLAIAMAVMITALVMGIAQSVHPAFWAGFIVIGLVGTLDDLRDLGHGSKFVAQAVAAGLMIFWAGLHLQSLGNLLGAWPLGLGAFALPLTFIAVVGLVNAINFTDGADGLSGGLVFNALFWLCAMEMVRGGFAAGKAEILFAFLGAVAGFLAFNLRWFGRRRALAFLGDSGSLGLGFVLAWFTVAGTTRELPLYAPVTAVWLLAVPLADTLTCAGRRVLSGSSPFKADRKHLHHILMDLGLTAPRAVAVIHAAAFLLGAAGVAGWQAGVPEHLMFYAAMAIFASYILFSALALRAIEARRRGRGLRHAGSE